MRVNPYEPIFTQRQVAECTSADVKAIDNLLQWKHIKLEREGRRRLFSLFQMIEIEIITRLATVLRVPPNTGALIARDYIERSRGEIERDAEAAGDRVWAQRAASRVEVTIKRHPDGEVEVVDAATDPEAIHLVLPAQLFARTVMVAAKAALEQPETAEE